MRLFFFLYFLQHHLLRLTIFCIRIFQHIQIITQSSSDELRRKRHEGNRPNHILLFTIINPVYPITVVRTKHEEKWQSSRGTQSIRCNQHPLPCFCVLFRPVCRKSCTRLAARTDRSSVSSSSRRMASRPWLNILDKWPTKITYRTKDDCMLEWWPPHNSEHRVHGNHFAVGLFAKRTREKNRILYVGNCQSVGDFSRCVVCLVCLSARRTDSPEWVMKRPSGSTLYVCTCTCGW